MADFDENVEEMVGDDQRSGGDGDRVRLGQDGDETENETGGPGDETSDETAGDEMTATGGLMYTDEGKYEFDEDEMAALEGQRLVAEFKCEIQMRNLVAELFPEGFHANHASEPAGNLSETTEDRKRSPSRMMMKA